MRHIIILALCLLSPFANALSGDDITVLPVEQAFSASAHWSNQALTVEWHITPGHYLYQDKFAFEGHAIEFARPELPTGFETEDPYLGKVTVYPESFSLNIPLLSMPTENSQVRIAYQGCAASGFCYEPMQALISSDGTVLLSPKLAPLPPPSPSPTSAFEQSFWMVLLSFLGFGMLLSLTPCVLPMLPILYGILCNQKSLSTSRAFALSVTYVLSMACAYALLGMIAASLGQTLQSAVQTPLIVGAFSGLLILMGLLVLEWLPVHLPAMSCITSLQNRLPKASFLGAAGMGALATLVTSPCVTAPLIGALTYIAQTQDRWLGGWALFALGLGMGLPLIALGTVGGQYLPKAGAWMRHVNSILGLSLLALALWLLLPFLPQAFLLGGAAILAVLTALRFKQPLTTVCLIAAIIWGAGAWQGKTHLLFFMDAFKPTTQTEPVLTHQAVTNLADFQQAIMQNEHSLLFVHADWCVSCQHIKHQVLNHPQIQSTLANWQVYWLDVTHTTSETKAFMQHYGLFAPPALLFFDHNGQELKSRRIVAKTTVGELSGNLSD